MENEARYLTDDRDSTRRNELIIYQAGNGDWYIGTCPEGEQPVGKMVRLCTSGGASFRHPGLTRAISAAYRAITTPPSKTFITDADKDMFMLGRQLEGFPDTERGTTIVQAMENLRSRSARLVATIDKWQDGTVDHKAVVRDKILLDETIADFDRANGQRQGRERHRQWKESQGLCSTPEGKGNGNEQENSRRETSEASDGGGSGGESHGRA